MLTSFLKRSGMKSMPMIKATECGGVLIAFCLITFSTLSYAQFRVIGYVHSWKEELELTKIPFDKITHLNIAFINPDSSFRLVTPPALDTLVKTSHRFGVSALASIGGGSHNPYYASLLNDTNRTVFIDRLVQLVIDYNLDGIDVDLEIDAIDSNYEKLVMDLSTRLKPMNKLLTSAVATWNGEKISDAALRKFDFINVMSYDQTGPWRPEKPGPHSTFAKAKKDLRYWTHRRKFSKKKLNLGLPFYGYCFGTLYGASMSYGEIIKTFPGSEVHDEIVPPGGGNIYYNGLPTIKRKTSLALKKAGGIMIWQLMQDDTGDHSLLTAIQHVISH